MDYDGNKIIVEATAPDIPEEIRECLGRGKVHLTLGGFMALVAEKSPYVYGGDVHDDEFAFAVRVLQAQDAEDPHEAICEALERAFNVLEMVVENGPQKPRKEEDSFFGPEWLTDIASSAMHAGLTWNEAVWGLPLLLVLHLVLAEYRRNGGETRRGNKEAEEKAIAELIKRRNNINGRTTT